KRVIESSRTTMEVKTVASRPACNADSVPGVALTSIPKPLTSITAVFKATVCTVPVNELIMPLLGIYVRSNPGYRIYLRISIQLARRCVEPAVPKAVSVEPHAVSPKLQRQSTPAAPQ